MVWILAFKERRVRIVYMKKKAVIAVIVLLLLGGGYWLFAEVTKPLPGKEVVDQGRDHVDQKKWGNFKYNSNPPTSGPHDPVWTTKGIYKTSAVDLGKGHLLHSLEHGYIEIHYNCQAKPDPASQDDARCQNLIKQLTDIVNQKGLFKMILLPNPTIDTKVSVVAWHRIDPINPAGQNGTLNDIQKKEVEDFIDSFRDHGPEQTMEP